MGRLCLEKVTGKFQIRCCLLKWVKEGLPLYLDGLFVEVLMDIQNAYNEWSETYDADENLTRDLDRQVTRDVLGDLHVDSLFEIGCGTGKNTVFLAQIARQVNAVDFSQGMIEKAKEKVKAENVHFSMMDITQPWKFEDRSFGLIVCNLVLEHIRDMPFVFTEAARTLHPGG